jgi:hypothetical protein
MDFFGLPIYVLSILVGTTIYFLPTIIAFARGRNNRLAISALNLLLGWTFLGWVVAIVWSLTGNGRGS